MSITSFLSKTEVQKALYEAGANVPPMPIFGEDADGIPEWRSEEERDADVLVSIDIDIDFDCHYVTIERDGEFETVYGGGDFQEALRAYREAAVEGTMPL